MIKRLAALYGLTTAALCLAVTLDASAQSRLPLAIKGIAYFSFRDGAFADQTQQPVLDYIEGSGANWVSFATPFFWDDDARLFTRHRADGNVVSDFEALPVAISRAQQRHLKTSLYVFVERLDGSSFFDPSARPANTDEFFRQFGNLLTGYADLAEREHIDLLVLGNEMNSLTGPEYREQWVTMIKEVRRRYHGLITYNAIPNYFIPNLTMSEVNRVVSFWDNLDVIGFSVYPQLSTSDTPSQEEIALGWTNSLYTRSNLLRNLKAWNTLTQKPILFVEIGYPSANGAAIKPGQSPGGVGIQNLQLQADLYEVMFEQVSQEAGPWLEGMFLWSLNTWNKQNDPYLQQRFVDLDFSFINKPAGDVIDRWYTPDTVPLMRLHR